MAAGRRHFAHHGASRTHAPIYGLDRLAQRPTDPVLVVEGEKSADAAGKIFPDHVVTTSPFGAKSANKADWTPLHGRTVVIWPDNDTPGAKYAADVARLVPGATVVPFPSSWRDGWDLADDLPVGVTIEALKALLLLAAVPKATKGAKSKPKSKPKPDDLKQSVEEVKRERDAMLRKIRALTSVEGRTAEEKATYEAKARELAEEFLARFGTTEEELESCHGGCRGRGRGRLRHRWGRTPGQRARVSPALCFLPVAVCIRGPYVVDRPHAHDGPLGQHTAHCVYVAGEGVRENEGARGNRASRAAPRRIRQR